jgi:hypothetical protein
LTLPSDDGIVVVPMVCGERREGPMWKVDQALAENTHFTQLETGGWRAEYHGFVTVSAEGRSPSDTERRLSMALDELLASLIRGGKAQTELTMDAIIEQSLLSDAIAVVNNTARQTAAWKKKRLRKPNRDAASSVETENSRKRR